MKPFTSKHCTQYLTKSSPFNQEDDKKKKEKKDNTFKYLKGFVSSAERSKKDNTKTSTEDFYKRKRELEAKNSAPTNYNEDKKKEKPLTRAEINKKYQGKLDTKKGPKGPGHSGRFNELISKKVTSGDKGPINHGSHRITVNGHKHK